MANSRYLDFLAMTSDFEPNQYFGLWWDTETSVLDFLNVRYLLTDTTTKPPVSNRWSLVYDGPDGRIFENRTVLPRFYAVRNVLLEHRDPIFARQLREMAGKWPHTALLDHLELETQQMHDDFFYARPPDAPVATAEILEATPTSYLLRVRAPRWSLVASSVPWWPGWQIERNGQAVEPIRVNHAFIGFAVPEGTWDVRVRYAPATFRWGATVSLATILVLAVLCTRAPARARGRAGAGELLGY